MNKINKYALFIAMVFISIFAVKAPLSANECPNKKCRSSLSFNFNLGLKAPRCHQGRCDRGYWVRPHAPVRYVHYYNEPVLVQRYYPTYYQEVYYYPTCPSCHR